MDARNQVETEKIIAFIEEIGIPVRMGLVDKDSFLPGIYVDRGSLVVDMEKLKWPGDLLHEAGHIALLSPEERAIRSGNVEAHLNNAQKAELGVICWSWAALLAADVPAESVFHDGGYRDFSPWLNETYRKGHYPGLPLLIWMELTDKESFPQMHRWLRETSAVAE